MKKHVLTILCFCLMTASCGWQIRGHKDSAVNIHALTVGGTSPYGRMVRSMEKQMQQQRIKSSGENAWYLMIITEDIRGTALAFGDSNNAASNEIELKVRFTVTDTKGETIIAPNTERAARIYTVNDNRRLAMDSEAELLTTELYDEMAINILRRIDFIAGQKTLQPHPSVPKP